MKKIVLTLLSITTAVAGFAQHQKITSGFKVSGAQPMQRETAAKSGDTLFALDFSSTQLSTDSLIAYYADAAAPADSGYISGMNPYGDKGWAERFDVNGVDSVYSVIGAFYWFTGNFQANSTKTIKIKLWSQGPKTAPFTGHSKVYVDGYPATAWDSASYSITKIGINKANHKADTLKYLAFTTPYNYVGDSFFVGYTMDYTPTAFGGDTIGLYTTRDGYRYAPGEFYKNGDTVINVKNASQYVGGTWHDNNYENFFFFNHFAVIPVIIVKKTTGIADHGISKNNLTFFGSYPNPATNETKVRIALQTATNVTITVMDMSGRTVSTLVENKLTAGTHDVPVNTSALATGTYMYIVRTQEGDAMASQLTIAK